MGTALQASSFTAAWVFALLLSLPVPAAAQDDADLARARASFQQAVELEQAGNCSAALPLFRQVGQVRMTPQVRFHIAICEAKLGRLVAALGGFELALAEADSVGQGFRDEVESHIQRLRERIPKLTLQRGSGAEAATIELDGVVLGSTSIGVEVPLDPGPHTIAAHARGYQRFEQTINLEEGEAESLEIVLQPAPVTPDDSGVGGIIVTPQPKPRILPYVIGGAGVASILASGVFFALRQSSLSELDDQCPSRRNCDPSLQGENDRMKLYHYGSLATLGVGVAALGTAATLLMLENKEKPPQEQAHLTVYPTLLPTSAAAHVRVTF